MTDDNCFSALVNLTNNQQTMISNGKLIRCMIKKCHYHCTIFRVIFIWELRQKSIFVFSNVLSPSTPPLLSVRMWLYFYISTTHNCFFIMFLSVLVSFYVVEMKSLPVTSLIQREYCKFDFLEIEKTLRRERK
jgi:hypothetical protein